MIKTIINHNPIKPPKHTPYVMGQHSTVSHLPNDTITGEVYRRNSIVKELAAKFLAIYHIGDRVKMNACPDSDEEFYITHVCRQYSDLGVNESWPKNDNPFIVSLFSKTTKKCFHCTITAITKY
jgi:hypothetical protein